ncbi:RHS repeat domain-containing protein [Olleya sp. Bg11-27]|uniref:RHS repeat domain-containing protein n=1 Tax=Olleya sp. Bg11-27 TaxID=2058135 RepID=UPI000C302851|nr:RHS repeat-associated core domain-containing protein [Olleya sp. Bg11-27]AUC77565.1 hypothetical protein CW732_18520 [Olleya sp. Bg11-27]
MKKIIFLLVIGLSSINGIGQDNIRASVKGETIESIDKNARPPVDIIVNPNDPIDLDPIDAACPFGQIKWYRDIDGDGYGQNEISICATSQPVGYVNNNTDCNDANANYHTRVWHLYDNDGDGIGGSKYQYSCYPPLGGNYVTVGGDCDDSNASIGLASVVYYQDLDNDGYGDPNVSNVLCSQPSSGYVTNSLDECPEYYGTLPNGCPANGIPEDMNWLISRSYDIQGSMVSNSKAYFDELGKNTQNQVVDLKTGKTWVNSTLYDVQGRAALQTLSAPVVIDNGTFSYQSNFIKKDNGNTYANLDFESNPEEPSQIGSQANSLGWYYSESNNSERYQDVTKYPFSRTIYSKLNPGSTLKTIGGNKVDQNGTQWISGFSYTMPAAQELYYAFGKGYFGEEGVLEENEEVVTKFYKSVSIDVHGNESVVFTDGEGKTLAAARCGGDIKYEVVSVISAQGFVDIHVPNRIVNSDIEFLGDSSNYRVYDLRTEQTLPISQMTGGHFYRVEYLGNIENTQLFINADGSFNMEGDVKGVRYKVNYYDYTLNYYDKAGRLTKTTQPLGFNQQAFDLTAENPEHQLASTYKYNSLNQLLETTSPDQGTANFIYREDGQIRFSQNSKQSIANEFSYTNYDDLARPIESGVYSGPLSFGTAHLKSVTLNYNDKIKVEGNTISKTPGLGWNSGLATIKKIVSSGYIQWRFSNADMRAMVGLSNTNTDYDYNTIKYAIYARDNIIKVYESGVDKGDFGIYTPEDTFKIERVGSTIYYKKNSITFYTSTVAASGALIGDFSLYSKNAKISGFILIGNALSFDLITFKNEINITSNGATVIKSGGDNTLWDAGANTLQVISGDGAIQFKAMQNNKSLMTGLSSHCSVASAGYDYIDYAIYLHENGSYYIYESGNYIGNFGSYATNDTFKVERVGSQIKYFKNGVLFYTSNKYSFNEDLIGDISIRGLNGGVSNVSLISGVSRFEDYFNVATFGNEIEKIGDYSWSAYFSSNEMINGDGFVKFDTPENTNAFMLGLSDDTSTSAAYSTIDFAIYLARNQRVYVYESGSNKGQKSTYLPGDTFKVERIGNTVRYYKNDEVIYTSTGTNSGPLLTKASFASPEASIENLQFYDLVNSSSVVDFNTTLDPEYCKEVHRTLYDIPNYDGSEHIGLYEALETSGINSGYYRTQKFVAGNVSKTYTLNPKTTATWYSYDIYGRVEWVVQYIDGIGAKTIDYEYDPIKGQVTKIIYQKHDNNEETFVHKYEYNTVGQLERVATSTNNQPFIEQAKYGYYETGALKRTDLRGGIQGTDYVYNLAGQLKAINHPSLKADNDPGGDTNDAFGMHIDYYKGDYARSNTPTPIVTSADGYNRFDGNIKATRWATRGLDPNASTTQNAYIYRYDKNKWLKDAGYGKTNNAGVITPDIGGQYLVSNLTYDANGNLLSLNRNKNGNSNSMDNFTYNYNPLTNQLNHVTDAVVGNTGTDDLKTQQVNNYIYNSIGQLVTETQDGKQIGYTYNASGLVSGVKVDNIPYINFYYNDKGHRVRKEVTEDEGVKWKQTYYVRDVAGSVMAIYTAPNQEENPKAKEYPIYGSGRLGVYNKEYDRTNYQLTDHLGNVRAVLTDGSEVSSFTDYYPFGMPMPERKMVNGIVYRYAFQGQELDPETGKEAFQLRLWDSRIGRWTTTDPYGQFYSPYLGMGNNPTNSTDSDGGCVGADCKWYWQLFNYVSGRGRINDELTNDIGTTNFTVSEIENREFDNFSNGFYQLGENETYKEVVVLGEVAIEAKSKVNGFALGFVNSIVRPVTKIGNVLASQAVVLILEGPHPGRAHSSDNYWFPNFRQFDEDWNYVSKPLIDNATFEESKETIRDVIDIIPFPIKTGFGSQVLDFATESLIKETIKEGVNSVHN